MWSGNVCPVKSPSGCTRLLAERLPGFLWRSGDACLDPSPQISSEYNSFLFSIGSWVNEKWLSSKGFYSSPPGVLQSGLYMEIREVLWVGKGHSLTWAAEVKCKVGSRDSYKETYGGTLLNVWVSVLGDYIRISSRFWAHQAEILFAGNRKAEVSLEEF